MNTSRWSFDSNCFKWVPIYFSYSILAHFISTTTYLSLALREGVVPPQLLYKVSRCKAKPFTYETYRMHVSLKSEYVLLHKVGTMRATPYLHRLNLYGDMYRSACTVTNLLLSCSGMLRVGLLHWSPVCSALRELLCGHV